MILNFVADWLSNTVSVVLVQRFINVVSGTIFGTTYTSITCKMFKNYQNGIFYNPTQFIYHRCIYPETPPPLLHNISGVSVTTPFRCIPLQPHHKLAHTSRAHVTLTHFRTTKLFMLFTTIKSPILTTFYIKEENPSTF